MDTYKEKTPILSDADIKRILLRLAHQVLEKNPHAEQLVFIGIQTRGIYLAQRLQKIVKELEGIEIPLGILDITLYRDDLTTVSEVPLVKETKIPFDLKNRIVILIDDVLFTGRTIRAALDEIMDFGRPHRIELLVLIDRGHRELPIRADFVGKNIPTAKNELVEIRLKEIDGKDEAVILQKKP
jgi:pyrimidine operon attenuation protein/uracil phosphoribosyltransferase